LADPRERRFCPTVWPAILLALLSASLLYRSPYNASNLDLPPDSIEYALAGHRLVFEGRYAIQVAGSDYPPRYPPWFSLLVALHLLVLGHRAGNASSVTLTRDRRGHARRWHRSPRRSTGGSLAGLTVLALPEVSTTGDARS
jgi:hypothetical protein